MRHEGVSAGDAVPPTSIAGLLRAATESLAAAGVEFPGADARLLVARGLRSHPTWLIAHDEEIVDDERVAEVEGLVQRRSERVPLQHLLGEQEFWSLRMTVGPQVLIPRPETEHLVEAAIAAARSRPIRRLADIGTGSGCLAIALASELPGAQVFASDLSQEALATASRNAGELGFEDRIDFRQGDLTEPLRELGPFDAVVANLPYVARAEWRELEPEVRDHEPELALVGGEDGTELVFRLIDEVPCCLAEDAWLGLEVGHDQGSRVAAALRERGFAAVEVLRDFAGIERIVSGRRPAALS